MDISVSEEEQKNEDEEKTFSFQFPFILLRTRRGLNVMDRIAASRLTKPFGSASLILFPFIGAIGFVLILFSASVMLSNAPVREFVRESGPLVHLLIPGLNPYVPLIYGWIALIVAMIVHEGSHGIFARSFNLRVKSSGLIFFFVLLIGAFVDIDEEEIKKAPARKTGRVMAGGPMSNFITSIASLACLMLLVGSMTPVADGIGVIGVYEDSPAHVAGLAPHDIVIAVNGERVTGGTDVNQTLSGLHPGDRITLTYLHDGREVDQSLVLDAWENSSRPFIGFEGLDSDFIQGVLKNYQTPSLASPLIYFFLPTFTMGQINVPYSDTMTTFYTSPLGEATFAMTNLLFWLWFVNFNLAIFNALPLYPLDGGQALRAALSSYGVSRGWKEKTAMRFVTAISLIIVGLLASVIAGPYLLG
jgi:membrane-associated protease RseP (regulator of RpoE activity)